MVESLVVVLCLEKGLVRLGDLHFDICWLGFEHFLSSFADLLAPRERCIIVNHTLRLINTWE